MNAVSENTSPANRFDGVDVLRGISILAVILLHISIRLHSVGVSLDKMMPHWTFHLLFRNGNNGVTVFFAISGFLITFTSLRRFGSLAKVRPAKFYRIRFARIAPLLLLILAIVSMLHLVKAPGFYISPQKTTLLRAVFAALTFHLNWLEAVRGYLPANWDVLWSLSVEEMFYLLFPLVCVAFRSLRYGTPIVVVLLLSLVAIGPFARSCWTTNPIWQEKSYLGGMDGIALGCLSALLTSRLLAKGVELPRYLLELSGAAMMFLIAFWPNWAVMTFIGRTGLDSTMLALGTCLVIISTVLRRTAGGLFTASIRWFGRHSYEVYMTHEFVVVWVVMIYGRVPHAAIALWILAIVALCAPLGFLLARYFSEPLNRRLRGSRLARNTQSLPQLLPAHCAAQSAITSPKSGK